MLQYLVLLAVAATSHGQLPGNQAPNFAQAGGSGGLGLAGIFAQAGGHRQPGGFGQHGRPAGFVQPGRPTGFGQTGGFGQAGGGFGQPGLVRPVGGGPTINTNAQLQYNCAASASQSTYGISATCKNWCKLPQHIWGGEYTCCENRQGTCPAVRAECPKFGALSGPPVCCFVDSQCQIPTHKCCFDKCLNHKVCKEAY